MTFRHPQNGKKHNPYIWLGSIIPYILSKEYAFWSLLKNLLKKKPHGSTKDFLFGGKPGPILLNPLVFWRDDYLQQVFPKRNLLKGDPVPGRVAGSKFHHFFYLP